MNFRRLIGVFILISALFLNPSNKVMGQENNLVVRVARLSIDSLQLEKYKTFLSEEIDASVRLEPGVLNLYAVFEKNNPTRVMVFEVYANEKAYRSHLETEHFKKYKNGTVHMVKSLELIEVVPIALKSKTGL